MSCDHPNNQLASQLLCRPDFFPHPLAETNTYLAWPHDDDDDDDDKSLIPAPHRSPEPEPVPVLVWSWLWSGLERKDLLCDADSGFYREMKGDASAGQVS